MKFSITLDLPDDWEERVLAQVTKFIDSVPGATGGLGEALRETASGICADRVKKALPYEVIVLEFDSEKEGFKTNAPRA